MSQHVIETRITDEPRLQLLRAALPGRVVIPGDAGWEQLRRGWNCSVDQHPAAVVNVSSTQDVVDVVRFAAEHGLSVAAQPVGHGATSAVTGTILLRTRGLDAIAVDPILRTARVGAGVKWGELQQVSATYGLTGLAGSSPDPTVVGFSVSGGLSWFGRKHGLAAHSVEAVELVDATGEHKRVTADSDPELFWAVCGGGGDFGIVTAMEIRLYPAPHVYGGRLLWPLEMAKPVLRAFRDISRSAPDELTMWAHLLQFPPIPDVPEPLRGRSFVSVDLTYLGSADDAEQWLMPLRTIPAQWMDTTGTVALDALGSICAEPVDPMPASETSGLLSELDDHAIDALLAAAGAGSDSPLTVVQIRHLGGALARATADQGPSGAVREPYQLFCLGIPMDPELAAGIELTFAAVNESLSQYLTGRTFFTFLGSTDDPTRAFDATALDRLQHIKRDRDPRGVIRSNRPVLRPGVQVGPTLPAQPPTDLGR